jgi:hypothetical protein
LVTTRRTLLVASTIPNRLVPKKMAAADMTWTASQSCWISNTTLNATSREISHMFLEYTYVCEWRFVVWISNGLWEGIWCNYICLSMVKRNAHKVSTPKKFRIEPYVKYFMRRHQWHPQMHRYIDWTSFRVDDPNSNHGQSPIVRIAIHLKHWTTLKEAQEMRFRWHFGSTKSLRSPPIFQSTVILDSSKWFSGAGVSRTTSITTTQHHPPGYTLIPLQSFSPAVKMKTISASF